MWYIINILYIHNMKKYPIVNNKKECSKCNLWLDISLFTKDIHTSTGFSLRCKQCWIEYRKKYNSNPENRKKNIKRCKEYDTNNKEKIRRRYKKYLQKEDVKKRIREKNKKWRLEQKQKCVDYKGGKCYICGYKECLAALDFHHINPLEKNKSGTGAIKDGCCFDKNKEELDKCVLLCVRCHREIHSGYRTLII